VPVENVICGLCAGRHSSGTCPLALRVIETACVDPGPIQWVPVRSPARLDMKRRENQRQMERVHRLVPREDDGTFRRRPGGTLTA